MDDPDAVKLALRQEPRRPNRSLSAMPSLRFIGDTESYYATQKARPSRQVPRLLPSARLMRRFWVSSGRACVFGNPINED